MHGAQEYTADTPVRLGLRALMPPLAQVMPFAIEDDNAFVPVTIRT